MYCIYPKKQKGLKSDMVKESRLATLQDIWHGYNMVEKIQIFQTLKIALILLQNKALREAFEMLGCNISNLIYVL